MTAIVPHATERSRSLVFLLLPIFVALGVVIGVIDWPAPTGKALAAGSNPDVERGQYLVNAMGCNDCHTPWKMGPEGPAPDMTRMLSGHPEADKISGVTSLPAPWGVATSPTFTAWQGPWGVSFAANLTPDKDTGLGNWTEADFKAAIQSGRHLGRGRPILPPMPVQNLAGLTDADLHAVFAYLQSIPALKNRVPEPLPPATGN